MLSGKSINRSLSNYYSSYKKLLDDISGSATWKW